MLLRPYQQQASDAVIDDLEAGFDHRLLIVAPTGSGKSHIIADLCNRLDGFIVCITHSQELVKQNAEKMEAIGLDVGVWCSALNRRERDKPIIMASIQSIFRNTELLESATAFIVDEAHRMSSGSIQYGAILKIVAEKQTPLIGLTATPFRLGSGCMIHGKDPMFEKVSYEISIGHLIANGFLCPLSNRFPNLSIDAHIDRSKLRIRKGEYTDESMAAQLDEAKVERQAKLISKVFRMTRRRCGIVFAVSIAHADALATYLRLTGLRVGVAHSKLPNDEASEAIEAFRNDKYDIIVNRDMLTTGFDKPELDFGVLARATKSASLYIQMVGRLMRPAQDKKIAMVLDLAGVVDEHGPIDAPEIDSQFSESHRTSEPGSREAAKELDEYEEEAGLSDKSPEKQAEEIRIKIHQSRDIISGKAWSKAYLSSVESEADVVLRVGRVTMRPHISKAGHVHMAINVFGKNVRTGGSQSARMYFNFWHPKDFVCRNARQQFRDLFGLEKLPTFFYPCIGQPTTPSGLLLMNDREYAEKLEARANDLLKFKLVSVIKEDSGYLTIVQLNEPESADPALPKAPVIDINQYMRR